MDDEANPVRLWREKRGGARSCYAPLCANKPVSQSLLSGKSAGNSVILGPLSPSGFAEKPRTVVFFADIPERPHQGILYQLTGMGLAMIRDRLAINRDKAVAG